MSRVSCPVLVRGETLEASNKSEDGETLNGWAIEDAFNPIPFGSDDFTHEEKKQPDRFDSEDPNDSTDEGKEQPEGFQQEGLESNQVLHMDDSASLNTDSGRKAFRIGEEPLGFLEPLSPSPVCDAPFMSSFSGLAGTNFNNLYTDEGKEEPEGFQQKGLESNQVLGMDDFVSFNTDSGRKAFCIGEEPLLEPLSPRPVCDAPFMSSFSGFGDEAGTYLYIRPCRGGATHEPRMQWWRRGPEGNVTPIA